MSRLSLSSVGGSLCALRFAALALGAAATACGSGDDEAVFCGEDKADAAMGSDAAGEGTDVASNPDAGPGAQGDAMSAVDVYAPTPDPVFPPGMEPFDFRVGAPPADWFSVSEDSLKVQSPSVSWQYKLGYLHETDGVSMRSFIDPDTKEDYSGGFDAAFKNYAWDKAPAAFTSIVPMDRYVDISVTTGLGQKVDRLYYGFAGVELRYVRSDAEWIEDFFHVAGQPEDIAFVVRGMNDIVGVSEGKRLWQASAALAYEKYGQKVNYGDTFIEANGGKLQDCLYKNHLIYGFINKRTGRGMGAVYPMQISPKDFRMWWTEANRMEIEFAPGGTTGTRWLFRVTKGRDEIIYMGKALVDANGFPGQ